MLRCTSSESRPGRERAHQQRPRPPRVLTGSTHGGLSHGVSGLVGPAWQMNRPVTGRVADTLYAGQQSLRSWLHDGAESGLGRVPGGGRVGTLDKCRQRRAIHHGECHGGRMGHSSP